MSDHNQALAEPKRGVEESDSDSESEDFKAPWGFGRTNGGSANTKAQPKSPADRQKQAQLAWAKWMASMKTLRTRIKQLETETGSVVNRVTGGGGREQLKQRRDRDFMRLWDHGQKLLVTLGNPAPDNPGFPLALHALGERTKEAEELTREVQKGVP
jgi:hypothetical protein